MRNYFEGLSHECFEMQGSPSMEWKQSRRMPYRQNGPGGWGDTMREEFL